jgi:hypothetical protein
MGVLLGGSCSAWLDELPQFQALERTIRLRPRADPPPCADGRWHSLAAGRQRPSFGTHSPAILQRTHRSSPDTRFFRAPTPTTGCSFTAITPCGPARVPLLTVREPPERPGGVDGPVSTRCCRSRTAALGRAIRGAPCPRRAKGTHGRRNLPRAPLNAWALRARIPMCRDR